MITREQSSDGFGFEELRGLPAFYDPDVLRERGFVPESPELSLLVSPPPVAQNSLSRQVFRPNLAELEAWKGDFDHDDYKGQVTMWVDTDGLYAASTYVYTSGLSSRDQPVYFVLLTEVFDRAEGMEARRQVIPWEDWCPE